MKKVDYDKGLYAIYAVAAAMSAETLGAWMSAFAAGLPASRPLTLADIGSGTGRFSPSLAEAFGGPVYGIEPSDRMREVADRTAAHPRVAYQAGTAESIPLDDSTVDAAVLYGVWHHIQDKPQAARELWRVVRPGGRLLVRTTSADRVPDVWWYPYFPRAAEVDLATFTPLAATKSILRAAGWEWVALHEVAIDTDRTRGEDFARLRTRVLSTFARLSESEVEEGFDRIAAELTRSASQRVPMESADLLVFARPPA